ncbi:MAG: hypothetical protein ACPGUE_14725 [Marinomonas sp.]
MGDELKFYTANSNDMWPIWEDEVGDRMDVYIKYCSHKSKVTKLKAVLSKKTDIISDLATKNNELKDALRQLRRQVILRSGQRHILEYSDIEWIDEVLGD